MTYPYEILPGLWLGNARVAETEEIQGRYSHVLNMAAGLPARPHPQQKYLHIELLDLDDITPHLDTIYRFVCDGLDNAGPVLVHCAMGKNRSAAACLAVLARRQECGVGKAHKLLQSKAPCAPALWFQEQIAVWLDESPAADGALAKFKQRLRLRTSRPPPDSVRLYYEQLGPQA